MGTKLLWTGLTIAVAGMAFGFSVALIVGAVIMGIGAVLLWLDR